MDGFVVGRLVCHPRLPLVVGIDPERLAVRVWGWDGGGLRELAALGADQPPNQLPWARRVLEVAWHPVEAMFVLAGPDGLLQWREPDGFQSLPGAPVEAAYRCLAFSPDGTTVWASPSSVGDDDEWERSDALDLATGSLKTGLAGWDTDVVAHPAGGLVTTLDSDQGATLVLFARLEDTRPQTFQVLRRALILDADGYGAPVFSADGRYFAIRGNAYESSVQIFEFPSLRRVQAWMLGEPNPGYPYPPDWLAEMDSWSDHNLAFVAGTLLIGTPKGTILQLGIDGSDAVEYDLIDSEPITALAVGADGAVLVAAGEVRVVDPVLFDRTPPVGHAATDLVATFLKHTSAVEDISDLREQLELTDGTRSFGPDELNATEADPTDPTWLQIRAHLNAAEAVPPAH